MVTSLKHYGSGGERLSCPHGAAKSFPVGTVKPVKVGDINCSECPCYNGIDPKSIDKRENYATMCCYPDFAPNNRMRTMDEDPKAKLSGTVAGGAKWHLPTGRVGGELFLARSRCSISWDVPQIVLR